MDQASPQTPNSSPPPPPQEQQQQQQPNNLAATFTTAKTIEQFVTNVNEIIRMNKPAPLKSIADLHKMGLYLTNANIIDGLVLPPTKIIIYEAKSPDANANMYRQMEDILVTDKPFLAVIGVQQLSEAGMDSFMELFRKAAKELGPKKMKLVLLISEIALYGSAHLQRHIEHWSRIVKDEMDFEYFLVLPKDPSKRNSDPRPFHIVYNMTFFSSRASFVVKLAGPSSISIPGLGLSKSDNDYKMFVEYMTYAKWRNEICNHLADWELFGPSSVGASVEE